MTRFLPAAFLSIALWAASCSGESATPTAPHELNASASRPSEATPVQSPVAPVVAAPEPTPVIPKPKLPVIRIPAELEKDRAAKPSDLSNELPPRRYAYSKRHDEIENRDDYFLDIHPLAISECSWRVGHVKVPRGAQYFLQFNTSYEPKYSWMAVTGGLPAELVFRTGEEPTRIESSDSNIDFDSSRIYEAAAFRLTGLELLDLLDAKRAKVSGKKGNSVLELEPCDVDAIRWFIAREIPGGEALLSTRFEIAEDGAVAAPANAEREKVTIPQALVDDRQVVLLEGRTETKFPRVRLGNEYSTDAAVEIPTLTINTSTHVFSRASQVKIHAVPGSKAGTVGLSFTVARTTDDTRAFLVGKDEETWLRFLAGEHLRDVRSSKIFSVLDNKNTTEAAVFVLDANAILDICQSRRIRVDCSWRNEQYRLEDKDVDAVRYFVWNQIPGGQDLMRKRYEIVESSK